MFSWLCDELLHTIIEADEHQTWASTFFASKEMGARMQRMCATCDLCKRRLRSVLEHLCKNDLAHHLRPILDDDRVRKSGIVSEPDSLLHYCEGAECTKIVVALAPDDLFQEMDGESPLIRACRKGLSACAEVMLATLPERQVLATSAHGFTPLATACLFRHPECVKTLLRHSRSEICRIRGVHMAIIIACVVNSPACVELLLRHSPPNEQVLAVTPDGTTPLIIACETGSSRCVELLLSHSPDEQVLAATSDGSTPLMIACKNGSTDCVELLLRHKHDEQVLAVNSAGTTALMFACETGSSRCVELLLRRSSNEQVFAVNSAGVDPLMIASKEGHTACVEIMLRHTVSLHRIEKPRGGL